MEMRAAGDVAIGEDLTAPVAPLAAALRDSHLHSHCSCCFRSIDIAHHADPVFLICGANCPVRYCSRDCCDADSATHLSSGECRFFRLLQSDPSFSSDDDSADLRLALRLLSSLEKFGFSFQEARVSGLMTNRDKFENLEGGRLMSLVRDSREEGELLKEETTLCLVLTNAVEVLVKGRFAVGVAVYGPGFSWFNHNCAPNSCYRFELASPGTELPGKSVPRVVAFGEESTLKTWNIDESKFNYGVGSCKYGPRIVVRSIKPIKKGEKVCLGYTDLLQPKEKRHSELWSNYRFVCCCRRCHASSPNYVDLILQAYTCSTSNSLSYGSATWWELNDYLEQSINNYMFDGDAEACCERLEIFLSQNLIHGVCQEEEGSSYRLCHLGDSFSNTLDVNLHRGGGRKILFDESLLAVMIMEHSEPKSTSPFLHPDLKSGFAHVPSINSHDDIFKATLAEGYQQPNEHAHHMISENNRTMNLHPLHYVSLKAFVTLASAYRVRAEGKLAFGVDETSLSEATELSKTAAAYSLLLAGGVHHLFLSETSLIASAAQLWVSAGETLLGLLRSLKQGSDSIKSRPLSCSHSLHYNIEADACFLEEFEGTCKGFYDCMKRTSQCLWPFLIEGLQYLTFINDPVDFSWFERRDGCQKLTCCDKETIWRLVYELAVHCLLYGGFLATVCYGFGSHLAGNARELVLDIQTMSKYGGFSTK
ncbi:protein SET DOMAIN GROUP 41 [Aristolochia californica]|uniref:protein SET DOMAIN GROUP 41 n=1 Tax=Aristolochia californica TaxID=171875 RepID=UPI0035DA4065